jgi:hypothetical protein
MNHLHHSKLSKLCIQDEAALDPPKPSHSCRVRTEILDKDEGMGDPAE